MDQATRYSEYEICKRRGHQPDGTMLLSNPPLAVCKWCGTHYRTSSEIVEQNVPQRPLPDMPARTL